MCGITTSVSPGRPDITALCFVETSSNDGDDCDAVCRFCESLEEGDKEA